MGIVSKSLGLFRSQSLENPSTPWSVVASMGGSMSDAGIHVSEEQAMRITTAHSAIKIISEDLSSVALKVYERMPDGSMRDAQNHNLYDLIKTSPNPAQHSMTFRGALLASVLAYGNGYAFIDRDRANRVKALVNLASSRTRPDVSSGRLQYVTTQTADGTPQTIEPDEIIHISGTSFDGITGMSPIRECRNAFGLAAAAEKFGAKLFANGARVSGVLSHPQSLGEEAFERLKASYQTQATGDNALRPMILEEGMTWAQISISPDDAQFLETRKFQRAEIAALYRVPLHLLQDLERSTNNNIEHQSIDYIRYCLRPWAVRVELEFNRKLLGGNYVVEHDMKDFLRGDFASQATGYTALRTAGVYSVNDIRRDMRENPIPKEEGGDIRLAPTTTVPLDSLVNWTPPVVATPAPAPKKPTKAYRRLVRDAVGRITNRDKWSPADAHKILQPIVAFMAEMEGLDPEDFRPLSFEIAAVSPGWSKEAAPDIADGLVTQIFERLHSAA